MDRLLPVSLTARDVMEKNVVTIAGSSTVLEAIKKMVSSNVWSLIVERNGLPVGLVTDRDVLRRYIGKDKSPDRTRVEDIMSAPIISVSPDDHVGKIMQTLAEKNIRRVFVVEEGKIIGRITQTKMFDDSLNVMLSISSLGYQM